MWALKKWCVTKVAHCIDQSAFLIIVDYLPGYCVDTEAAVIEKATDRLNRKIPLNEIRLENCHFKQKRIFSFPFWRLKALSHYDI